MVGGFRDEDNCSSQNLTPEKAQAGGNHQRDISFRSADVVTTTLSATAHGPAREGTRSDVKRHPPGHPRGPIVDKGVIATLQSKSIAGAGLDVFDVELLPPDHPFRKMDNVDHAASRLCQRAELRKFSDIVEDIRARRWQAGEGRRR
jgi:D-3-phosphoglycerate dehydrogenase